MYFAQGTLPNDFRNLVRDIIIYRQADLIGRLWTGLIVYFLLDKKSNRNAYDQIAASILRDCSIACRQSS